MGAERAEYVRCLISQRPVPGNSESVKVSMSLGVAGTDDWPAVNAERLIHEADVAPYRAKSHGRNASCSQGPRGWLTELRPPLPDPIAVPIP